MLQQNQKFDMSIKIFPQNLRGPCITEDRIREFEEHFSQPFPDDYRQYLMLHNGGEMENGDVDVIYVQPDSSDIYYIFSIFGIDHPKGYLDIDDYRKLNLEFGMYPNHFLAIGVDAGANYYCISLGDDDYGRIYFWEYELQSFEPGYENWRVIANNFTEFAESFRYER